MLLQSEVLDEVGLLSQTTGFISRVVLGLQCIVLAFCVGFLAELGPQLMPSLDFYGKFSSGRFTAQLLWFARLMLWNAG